MEYTAEHQSLYDTTRRYIEEQVNPHCAAWEKAGVWPARQVLKGMGDLGLLGISKPESVGGLGLDYSYQMAFAEALGHCSVGAIPMAIGVQTDMCTPAIARYGNDYLKENILRPSIAGDLVGAIGVSEPGAGSDVAAIKTTAVKDGGDYVINGNKMWITNGTQADWVCLLCNTGEVEGGGKHGNKSLIVVPLDAKGVDRNTKLDKLGQRSSDTAIIFFDNVRVPAKHLIGQEGRGFIYQMEQFQEERLFLSASILVCLEKCVSETAAYTRQRKAFGGSILDNQVVQFRLAQLQTDIEALRALTYRAIDLMLKGEDVTLLASMAKLRAGQLGREVPDACLQYWGGQGFMWENYISQMYRDLRLHAIGGGADEVMLGIISKRLGFGGKKKA